MVEGGDLLLSAPALQMLKDAMTTPFSRNSTELPAHDDVPDVQSPSSWNFTQPEDTPDIQSPSSGNITQPLLEQEGGDQPSPEHLWTFAGVDDSGGLYSMD